MTIFLGGLPGSSAGRVDGACSPCTGRGLASRRVATTLVGSYPTLSPLPPASPERCFAVGGLLSVPLSVGFRRLGSPQRPALRCPDFPRATRARGHPACTDIVASLFLRERRNHEAHRCARLPRRGRRLCGKRRSRRARTRARARAEATRKSGTRDR